MKKKKKNYPMIVHMKIITLIYTFGKVCVLHIHIYVYFKCFLRWRWWSMKATAPATGRPPFYKVIIILFEFFLFVHIACASASYTFIHISFFISFFFFVCVCVCFFLFFFFPSNKVQGRSQLSCQGPFNSFSIKNN